MSTIRRVLDRLQAAHKAATPEPWFLLWVVVINEEDDPEHAEPTAVGQPTGDSGGFEILVEAPIPNSDDDGANLRLVEEARNALPLLLAVAEAAHAYVAGPDAVGLERLTAALDGLAQLALEETPE